VNEFVNIISVLIEACSLINVIAGNFKPDLQRLFSGKFSSICKVVIMTYFQQLYPWCIIRILPNNQNSVVARFRRHDDAVAYLQLLQNSSKNIKLSIIFEVQGVEKLPENDAFN
jgi:hypothetical protein